jgi:hypothetical protein
MTEFERIDFNFEELIKSVAQCLSISIIGYIEVFLKRIIDQYGKLFHNLKKLPHRPQSSATTHFHWQK